MTEHKSLISIVIPTYNRSHFIGRALKSILDQDYPNWEVVIVDDGSTDNTREVIQPFLADKRISYISKENTGAAHSRNIGVEHTQGEYITFLDSDDEAKPQWLRTMSEEILLMQPDLLCCGCEILDQNGRVMKINLPEQRRTIFPGIVFRMTNGGVFVVKRNLFLEVGGYDQYLESGQHTELSFRLIPYIQSKKGKICNIYVPLIKIHIHLGERIRTNPRAKFLGSKRTLEKHMGFFKQRPIAQSRFAAITAYNAFLLKKRREAFRFAMISFRAKPSIKGLLRILRYRVF